MKKDDQEREFQELQMEIPREPAMLKCPACDQIVMTTLTLETTVYTWLVGVIVLFIFSWGSMCLLPFVVPLSKSLVHRCTKWDNKIAMLNPFNLPSLKDDVWSIKCGECAIVLTRTYLLTGFLIMACFLVVMNFDTVEHSHVQNFIPQTWEDYLVDCGNESLFRDPKLADKTFKNNYHGNTVTWEGYFMKVTDYSHYWFRGEHAAVFLAKMAPSESDIHADLILSLTDDSLERNRFQAMQLEKGDLFSFNATFVSMGNHHRLHHLHLETMEKLDGHMEISDHVHIVNQMYDVSQPMPQVTLVEVKDIPKQREEHNDVHIYRDDDEVEKPENEHN